MHKVTICAILIIGTVRSTFGATFGYHPVSLRPFNSTNSSGLASAWAAEPAPQSISITSFRIAETNRPPEVPRSNTYAVSIFRYASVLSTSLDLEIRDATGRTIVPRTKVILQSSPTQVQPLHYSASTLNRGRRNTKGKGLPMVSTPHDDFDDFASISEDALLPPKGRRHPMGRRKGKGGIMGGIGGGGRYGGGAGGFRSSTPGSSTRTYGYRSAAMNSRYAPGYTRTAYGYSGPSAMYVGTPMFFYMGASHGMYGHAGSYGCDRYSGTARSRCQQQFTNCSIESSTNCTMCSTRSSSPLIRDDLMAATVDVTRAVFPLNITIFNAQMTFLKSSQPEEWQNPLLLSFSEVDLDDEDSAALPFWGLCVLVALGTLFLLACCCWCIKRGWCIKCCKSRPASDGIGERNDSKELDVEAQQYPSGMPIEVMSEQYCTPREFPPSITIHGPTFEGSLAAPPAMKNPVSDTSKDLPCHGVDLEKVELELKPEKNPDLPTLQQT